MSDCKCREVVDLLLEYVEEALPDKDKQSLDRHFAECPPCLEFLESYRKLPRVVREATATDIPPEVVSRLRSFLAKRCK